MQKQLPCCFDIDKQFQAICHQGGCSGSSPGYSIYPEAEAKGSRDTATECNYNKEYFADKECQNCGKKGHPARCCTNKKGKAKRGSKDDKSVSSSKSIKSLTKQNKTLKKLVSVLQAHQEDNNNGSSLSSKDGDAHYQYACSTIEATNPKVAMVLKPHKARDLDLRSVYL
jgi:hypothetical protein